MNKIKHISNIMRTIKNSNKYNKCGKGKIVIHSYKTKNGKTIKKHCRKDMGNPGKGKKLFTLKKGDLIKYGYSLKNNAIERINSLNKAFITIPKNTLIRKLNAISILHKNTSPLYSKRAKNDMRFIQGKGK
jgi:hypothetical protein